MLIMPVSYCYLSGVHIIWKLVFLCLIHIYFEFSLVLFLSTINPLISKKKKGKKNVIHRHGIAGRLAHATTQALCSMCIMVCNCAWQIFVLPLKWYPQTCLDLPDKIHPHWEISWFACGFTIINGNPHQVVGGFGISQIFGRYCHIGMGIS